MLWLPYFILENTLIFFTIFIEQIFDLHPQCFYLVRKTFFSTSEFEKNGRPWPASATDLLAAGGRPPAGHGRPVADVKKRMSTHKMLRI